MRLKAKNSKAVLLLIVITTIIWGVVIYNIIDYLDASDNTDIEIITEENPLMMNNVNKDNSSQTDTISFIKLKRDPFRFAVKQRKVNKQKNRTPPPNKKQNPPLNRQKINYAINGVIINGKNKLVIFEDLTNNKTMFLREGEEYNNITIKEIGKTRILLDELGKEQEIALK